MDEIEFDSMEEFERWLEREQEEAVTTGQSGEKWTQDIEPTPDQVAIWRALKQPWGFWV